MHPPPVAMQGLIYSKDSKVAAALNWHRREWAGVYHLAALKVE
jgi:hypothetical protein